MTMQRRALLKTLAASSAAAAWPVLAQAPWPNRLIGYIVPFAPGGTTDILGRVVGEKLAIALGQPIVIENKPGQEGRSRPPAQAPAGP